MEEDELERPVENPIAYVFSAIRRGNWAVVWVEEVVEVLSLKVLPAETLDCPAIASQAKLAVTASDWTNHVNVMQ